MKMVWYTSAPHNATHPVVQASINMFTGCQTSSSMIDTPLLEAAYSQPEPLEILRKLCREIDGAVI